MPEPEFLNEIKNEFENSLALNSPVPKKSSFEQSKAYARSYSMLIHRSPPSKNESEVQLSMIALKNQNDNYGKMQHGQGE